MSMTLCLLNVIWANLLFISKFHLHLFSDEIAVGLVQDFRFICYGRIKKELKYQDLVDNIRPQQRMDCVGFPSGDRLQRIPSPVYVEINVSPGN